MIKTVAVLGDGRLARSLRTALGHGPEPLPPLPLPLAGDIPAGLPANALVIPVDDALPPSGLADANDWLYQHRFTGLPVHGGWDAITVGPLLAPGRPGCHRCLQARRQAVLAGLPAQRELLRRLETGRLAAPPPVLPAPLHVTVAALVAGELDRLHAGARPHTRSAVLRVDAGGLSVQRHRFLPDPACRTCGGVPDDTARAAVITFQRRPKRDPASYRSGATPHGAQLMERFVDPHAGLISAVRVGHHATTVDATATIHTRAPTAPPAGIGEGAGTAPAHLRCDGAGRGLDRRSSVTVAILEALERYAGLSPDLARRTVVTAGFRELPAGEAIDPRTFGLPQPEQLMAGAGYLPYRPDLALAWVWGWSFRRERPVLVPESLAFYYHRPGPRIAYECSSGCALGSCLEEAILHGVFEVVERDGFLLTWYARLPVPRVDWRTVTDPTTRLLATRLEATTGDRLHLLNTTMPEGLPSIAAMVVDEHDRPGYAKAFFGGGADLSPERAVAKAVREVALSDGRSPLSAAELDRARTMLEDADLVTELPHHGWLYQLPEAWPRLRFLCRGATASLAEAFPVARRYRPSPDLTEDLRSAVDRYLAAGLDVVVVNQTTPEQRDAGLVCVKVLIPGTLPMTFGHRHRRAAGIARLHSMPARLGYRNQPLPIEEINPYPHPFT